MDDFKNSTKTQYLSKGNVRGAAQMNQTLKRFKEGGHVVGPVDDQSMKPSPRGLQLAGPDKGEKAGPSLSIGKVGTPVRSQVVGDRTVGKGYGVTARIPFKEGGEVKGQAKVGKVMGEFGEGKLHSGSKKGPVVTNPKQAKAIALSEARKAGANIPVKKARGGSMDESTSARPVPTKDRELSAAVARGNRVQAEEAGELAVRRGVPAHSSEPLIKGRSYPGRAGDIPVRKSTGGYTGKKC